MRFFSVPSWINGKKVAFDISVVSPTQDAVLHRTAKLPAAAIEMSKNQNAAHFNNCTQGIVFLPLVVETFGGCQTTHIKDVARL